MASAFGPTFTDDHGAVSRRDNDQVQKVLLDVRNNGRATDVRFNPETRRLELVYDTVHQ